MCVYVCVYVCVCVLVCCMCRVPLASTLTSLDMSANFIKDEGATALEGMLKDNRRLK